MPRTKKILPVLKFVIDTREQWPLSFGALLKPRTFAPGGIVRYGLGEGDYGCELDEQLLPIRLERKSLGDLFGSCGYGRERLEREFERLRQYDYRALLIEATLGQVLAGHERSRISGRVAAASCLAWSVHFGLQVVFAENHRRAGAVAQRLLETFAEDFLTAG